MFHLFGIAGLVLLWQPRSSLSLPLYTWKCCAWQCVPPIHAVRVGQALSAKISKTQLAPGHTLLKDAELPNAYWIEPHFLSWPRVTQPHPQLLEPRADCWLSPGHYPCLVGWVPLEHLCCPHSWPSMSAICVSKIGSGVETSLVFSLVYIGTKKISILLIPLCYEYIFENLTLIAGSAGSLADFLFFSGV